MAFDIGELFRRIFTPAGTGGLEANTQKAVYAARMQANDALAAQRDATAAIAAAAVPAIDREDVRAASEQRLKQMLARGSFMDNFSAAPTAPAPINYKQLFGAP